jgi:hypothetical protein
MDEKLYKDLKYIFINSIALQGYFSTLQQTKCVKMFGRMPLLLTWHISYTIVDHLSPIVFLCVLNQFWSHCVFNDTLCSVIFMSLKLREEIKIQLPLLT